MITNNDVISALSKGVNIFYQTMMNRLNEPGKYPSGDPNRGTSSIQEATHVTSPKKVGDEIVASIEIDLQKAPYARAFEYGSGEKGGGSRYAIEPKEGTPALVFPKERWPQYVPPPPAPNFFRFFIVHHPGIAAQPYIRPTIDETRQRITKIVGQEVIISIKNSMPKQEIIK